MFESSVLHGVLAKATSENVLCCLLGLETPVCVLYVCNVQCFKSSVLHGALGNDKYICVASYHPVCPDYSHI